MYNYLAYAQPTVVHTHRRSILDFVVVFLSLDRKNRETDDMINNLIWIEHSLFHFAVKKHKKKKIQNNQNKFRIEIQLWIIIIIRFR